MRMVSSVGEAQDVAISGAFDVVVCDLMLPDRSGLDFCRWLRERALWVPFLLMSASGADDVRVAALANGADDFLAKPFSLAELSSRVRSLAERGPLPRRPRDGDPVA